MHQKPCDQLGSQLVLWSPAPFPPLLFGRPGGYQPSPPCFPNSHAVLCSAHAGVWHQAALFQPHQFQISLQMHFKGEVGGGGEGERSETVFELSQSCCVSLGAPKPDAAAPWGRYAAAVLTTDQQCCTATGSDSSFLTPSRALPWAELGYAAAAPWPCTFPVSCSLRMPMSSQLHTPLQAVLWWGAGSPAWRHAATSEPSQLRQHQWLL